MSSPPLLQARTNESFRLTPKKESRFKSPFSKSSPNASAIKHGKTGPMVVTPSGIPIAPTTEEELRQNAASFQEKRSEHERNREPGSLGRKTGERRTVEGSQFGASASVTFGNISGIPGAAGHARSFYSASATSRASPLIPSSENLAPSRDSLFREAEDPDAITELLPPNPPFSGASNRPATPNRNGGGSSASSSSRIGSFNERTRTSLADAAGLGIDFPHPPPFHPVALTPPRTQQLVAIRTNIAAMSSPDLRTTPISNFDRPSSSYTPMARSSPTMPTSPGKFREVGLTTDFNPAASSPKKTRSSRLPSVSMKSMSASIGRTLQKFGKKFSAKDKGKAREDPALDIPTIRYQMARVESVHPSVALRGSVYEPSRPYEVARGSGAAAESSGSRNLDGAAEAELFVETEEYPPQSGFLRTPVVSSNSLASLLRDSPSLNNTRLVATNPDPVSSPATPNPNFFFRRSEEPDDEIPDAKPAKRSGTPLPIDLFGSSGRTRSDTIQRANQALADQEMSGPSRTRDDVDRISPVDTLCGAPTPVPSLSSEPQSSDEDFFPRSADDTVTRVNFGNISNISSTHIGESGHISRQAVLCDDDDDEDSLEDVTRDGNWDGFDESFLAQLREEDRLERENGRAAARGMYRDEDFASAENV
ncbi:hypothetical protein BJ508DRAFT_331420 [Ascobolus immersus RN42]|uniref:Uncharacterized protein n=1 Tax=Ascobolus immersus RN42 TaxID=1160509 RepID=A0A3N4HS56_ASCIM|nr:hypothetical protein BJ508DRAFT_331420 [Ascobolus immersus RN42]